MSIAVSDRCAAILDGRSYTLRCKATVTRDGTVLADDIPVITGSEEFDDSLFVPERVVITVPKLVDGVDMTPTEADSPLAPYGQRLHIKLGVDVGNGLVEWLDRGEFLIQTTEPGDTTVTVTAVGLLELINEARLITPWKPFQTFTKSLRALLEPAVTLVIDPAVTALDRTVPSDLNEDEDRLKAAVTLLRSWPSRAQITPDGYLSVVEDDYYPAGPVVQRYNFTEDGEAYEGANIVQVGGAVSRTGLINVLVARGQMTDGTQIQAAAYDSTSGPSALGTPFNPFPIPEYYFSPLLTTVDACRNAARALLKRKAGLSAKRYQLTCVPDPRILGNDLLTYRPERSADPDRDLELVAEKVTMPYTSGSGPMVVIGRQQADL